MKKTDERFDYVSELEDEKDYDCEDYEEEEEEDIPQLLVFEFMFWLYGNKYKKVLEKCWRLKKESFKNEENYKFIRNYLFGSYHFIYCLVSYFIHRS